MKTLPLPTVSKMIQLLKFTHETTEKTILSTYQYYDG